MVGDVIVADPSGNAAAVVELAWQRWVRSIAERESRMRFEATSMAKEQLLAVGAPGLVTVSIHLQAAAGGVCVWGR